MTTTSPRPGNADHRRFLFVLFTNDACRRNHAFMFAIDLAEHGHAVRLILEGEAVRCVREREGRFGPRPWRSFDP